MSPFVWSLVVWVAWGVVAFLALEIPALLDLVPWNTFSWTFAQLVARNKFVALIAVAFVVDLAIHLTTGWPDRKGTRPEVEDTEGER